MKTFYFKKKASHLSDLPFQFGDFPLCSFSDEVHFGLHINTFKSRKILVGCDILRSPCQLEIMGISLICDGDPHGTT